MLLNTLVGVTQICKVVFTTYNASISIIISAPLRWVGQVSVISIILGMLGSMGESFPQPVGNKIKTQTRSSVF